MKTLYRHIAYLCFALLALSACTDEYQAGDSMPGKDEGRPMTLKLSYDIPHPRKIETRATEAEEKKLNTLEVFIFGSEGEQPLKGYKKITSGLKQDGTVGEFTIKTTVGNSLIYGIANAQTAVYSVDQIAQADWTEEAAQAGEIQFTLSDFKEKLFNRQLEAVNPTDGTFVMSGMMNEGQPVELIVGTDGTGGIANATADNYIIKLKRIVSKVHFEFKAAAGRTFSLLKYDIYNIPTQGKIIEDKAATAPNEYTHLLGNLPSTQAPNQINVDYLPENLQSANRKGDASLQKEREKNTYTDLEHQKSFDNAPANGTYVVAYGKYEETTGTNAGRVADVEYTIHLGDFKTDFNNYDNERNCKYFYSVTVNGVNEIVVEAKKEDESGHNPGVEGIVIDPKAGTVFTLDCHYESRVMRFYRSDIQALKQQGKGYSFLVETLGNRSDVYQVDNNWNDNLLPAGLDYKWVTFAKMEKATTNRNEPDMPSALAYGNSKGHGVNGGDELYSVPQLLKYLYDNADNTDNWSNYGNNRNKTYYMDFTCYVDENYYADRSWNVYTNLPPRKFYIANNVDVSTDTESVYAEVAYAIEQRSIQTFYNRNKSDELIAYGCETVNESPTNLQWIAATGGANEFDGRKAMVDYIDNSGSSWNNSWNSYTGNGMDNPMQTCMSRNRDLNRDGQLTLDEVRWYVPSYSQYNGLWIGEEALFTEARLYQKNTADLGTYPQENWGEKQHYFTSTKGKECFWSEEGSTYNGYVSNSDYQADYVKCVRNLQSNTVGVETVGTTLAAGSVTVSPSVYYSYADNRFDLTNVSTVALRTLRQEQELGNHHERDDLNKPRSVFQVSTTEMDGGNNFQLLDVIAGNVSCYGTYSENGTTSWRIPNQRELSLMFLENESLKLSNNNVAQGLGVLSRTAFSNQAFRSGFSTNLTTFRLNVPDGTTGWIRCVRDVD